MDEQILIKTFKNKYGELTIFGTERGLEKSRNGIENCTHEIPIVELIESKEYTAFIDIGASFGYFTRMASQNMYKVLAYEAHPLRFGFLKWNIRDLTNVDICENMYVGMGSVYLAHKITGMVRNNNPKRTQLYKRAPHKVFDSLLLDPIYNWLIKVDVEGNEEDVLNSAMRYLTEFQPPKLTWVVEIHLSRGVKVEDILNKFPPKYTREKILVRGKTEHWLFYER